MMTSHYGNLAAITPPMAPVCISRGHPRCKGGWRAQLAPGVVGRAYPALAPSWAALKLDDAGYDRSFAAQLAALDPRKVYDELGEDAVLLCFCGPNEFCHRRIVAEWFEFHLGILVHELGTPNRMDTPLWVNECYPFFQTAAQKNKQFAAYRDAHQT